MKHFDFLLVFLLLLPCASQAHIREKLMVEGNGYESLELSDGNGREIIPSDKYEFVAFVDGKFYDTSRSPYVEIKLPSEERSAMSTTSVSYRISRKEKQIERDGYVWYLIEDGDLKGVEDMYGNVILPPVYYSVRYCGDYTYQRFSGQLGVFIVTHAKMGADGTNYRYFHRFKAVYNLRGECIIPFERGYTDIVAGIQEKRSYPKLWYKFMIEAGGVDIEGICNTEGKELWRRASKDDYKNIIDYSDNIGFYYDSRTGRRIALNVYLSSMDTEWNKTVSVSDSPTFAETIASFSPVWTRCEDQKYRKLHLEEDGTKWYEVKLSIDDDYIEVEDSYHNLLISKDVEARSVFYNSNAYIGGVYTIICNYDRVNSKGDFVGFVQEAYTKEGNLIIGRNREYGIVKLEDKYFTVTTLYGVGVCDLNGYEVVAPEYESFEYDGYYFDGIKEDGRRVRRKIHNRPTNEQIRTINQRGGYYCNAPWLMMNGPQYQMSVDFWSTPYTNWSSMPIFGGVGDYVSSYSTDPCVRASIQIANSEARLMNEGVIIGNVGNGSTNMTKCPYCNGKGRKAVDYQAPKFTPSSNYYVHCDECGNDYLKSFGHSHVTCGHCGGSGYIR